MSEVREYGGRGGGRDGVRGENEGIMVGDLRNGPQTYLVCDKSSKK